MLLYDLLFGEGLQANGPAERAMLSEEVQLRAQLDSETVANTASPDPMHSWPRHARVNTLKWTVQEALSWLRCCPEQTTVGARVSMT